MIYFLEINFEIGAIVIIHFNAEIKVREGIALPKQCRVTYSMCSEIIQNDDDEEDIERLIPSVVIQDFLPYAYNNHFIFEKSETGEIVFDSIKKNMEYV